MKPFLKNLKKKREFYEFMKKKNIFLQVHYTPIHLNPYYKKLGFKKKMFPNSEEYADKAITLPIHLSVTKTDFKNIIKAIKEFFNN